MKTKISILIIGLTTVALALSLSATKAADALLIHPTDGSSSESFALDNVQRITFSGNDIIVETWRTASPDNNIEIYTLDYVSKITFGNVNSNSIANPSATSLDVLVYTTPAGEFIVESPISIKSLTLFTIDGKILATQTQLVGTLRATSLQASVNVSGLPSGVYILLIDTVQGTVAKKIIKNK